jgi:hypothetical protein
MFDVTYRSFLLRYHMLDIDCLFASLNMADVEEGEVP